MTGTLIYANSSLVTREQLKSLAPPPATATWKPIPHFDLITALERQLYVRNVKIEREQFAIQRAGARIFAVLDLSLGWSGEFWASMGLRNSTDKSLALELAVGVRVVVCDNLAFAGDLIAMRRKHTVGFDLNADLSRAVDRYLEHLERFNGQLDAMKERPLADEGAKGMIHDAFRQGILPLRMFPAVSETYFNPKPEMTDVQPRTYFGLHNSFTRAVKQLAPAPAFEATTELGKFFGLTTSPN